MRRRGQVFSFQFQFSTGSLVFAVQSVKLASMEIKLKKTRMSSSNEYYRDNGRLSGLESHVTITTHSRKSTWALASGDYPKTVCLFTTFI